VTIKLGENAVLASFQLTIVVGTTVPGPTLMTPPRPESPPIVPGSPESLPTLEALLGLPNRAVAPDEEEEEDLDLVGLF
jgi:hypothetical protein